MSRLILASQSSIRKSLLENAGLSFECYAANIDERALEEEMIKEQATPSEIALKLAQQKAKAISEKFPDSYIIGADQTMSFSVDGKTRQGHKPKDLEQAKNQLLLLKNKSHHLHSAVSCVKNGQILFSYKDEAMLTIRDFSEEFLENYLQKVGNDVLKSVGCYQLEGLGIQLFEKIEGNYFTILGLPLLPLLAFFQKEEIILK